MFRLCFAGVSMLCTLLVFLTTKHLRPPQRFGIAMYFILFVLQGSAYFSMWNSLLALKNSLEHGSSILFDAAAFQQVCLGLLWNRLQRRARAQWLEQITIASANAVGNKITRKRFCRAWNNDSCGSSKRLHFTLHVTTIQLIGVLNFIFREWNNKEILKVVKIVIPKHLSVSEINFIKHILSRLSLRSHKIACCLSGLESSPSVICEFPLQAQLFLRVVFTWRKSITSFFSKLSTYVYSANPCVSG